MILSILLSKKPVIGEMTGGSIGGFTQDDEGESFLAGSAIECGSIADNYTVDSRAADLTWLVFAVIDGKTLLKVSWLAALIEEITQGSSSLSDGFIEHFLDFDN